MKKLKYLILVAIIVIVNTISVYAETDVSKTVTKKAYIERNKEVFLSGGFNLEDLIWYEQEELETIVERKGKITSVIENTDMIVGVFESGKARNEETLIGYYQIPITKDELLAFERNEKPETYALKLLSDKNKTMQYFSKDGNETYRSIPEITENLDAGVITTRLTNIDLSTYTYCNDKIIYEFEWGEGTGMPLYTLSDGIGIYHNGGQVGLTELESMGGTVWVQKKSTLEFEVHETCNVEWNAYGISSEFDLPGGWAAKGRFHVTVRGNKNFVPEGQSFTAAGQYGHKEIAGSVQASVGVSGISLTPVLGMQVFKTTQITEVIETY